MNEINWAIQVDPEKWYKVRYLIHKGVKKYALTKIKGKDMTEDQIKEYVRGYR